MQRPELKFWKVVCPKVKMIESCDCDLIMELDFDFTSAILNLDKNKEC